MNKKLLVTIFLFPWIIGFIGYGIYPIIISFYYKNWIGGSNPDAGGSAGVDAYAFTIIKTGSAAYTVIGNQSTTS